jgi:hypothetical protein
VSAPASPTHRNVPASRRASNAIGRIDSESRGRLRPRLRSSTGIDQFE